MIRNKTRKKVLARGKKVCASPWCQAIGLMFSSRKQDYGLVFEFSSERKISLHMMFVFYPIDVLFLNAERKVVDVKEEFLPFTTYTSKKKVKYVIELPAGVLKSSKTALKDTIEF